jgi:hypothetical protein
VLVHAFDCGPVMLRNVCFALPLCSLLKLRRPVKLLGRGWYQQRRELRLHRGSWQELRQGMAGMRATAAYR